MQGETGQGAGLLLPLHDCLRGEQEIESIASELSLIKFSLKDTAAGEGPQRVAGGHHPVLPDRRRGLRPHLRHLPREGISGRSLARGYVSRGENLHFPVCRRCRGHNCVTYSLNLQNIPGPRQGKVKQLRYGRNKFHPNTHKNPSLSSLLSLICLPL